METYLFKFSACLVVFWLVYILFLERQTMHRFKRFYLLIAIASALVIPILTITKYVEPTPSDFEVSTTSVPIQPSHIEQAQVEDPFLNLETVLWTLYGLGVLIFATRFLVNLFRMYKRISAHQQIKKRPFIYVLLKDCRIPHSFFKYLFFERSKYETDAIPDEVKLHEETHARQLHSLDIIAIEFLQIVFWFHPLIYILKHHIKLNHEFLADQAVLNEGIDTKAYQKTLLQFSSNTHEYQLSSTINYSSIKKRFTVMKTQTSKTRMWLSSLLLLPIIAILFYSFAERVEVEKDNSENSQIQNSLNDTNEIDNPEYRHYTVQTFQVKNDDTGLYVSKTFTELPEYYKRKWIYTPSTPYYKKQISQTEFNNLSNSKKYLVLIDGNTIHNSELNNYYSNDFVTYSNSTISELAEMEQQYVYNLITKEGLEIFTRLAIISFNNALDDYNELINYVENGNPKTIQKLEDDYKFMKQLYEKLTPEIILSNNLKLPENPFQKEDQETERTKQDPPVMWILVNKNDQLLVDDELGSLKSIESKLKTLANQGKSGQLVYIRHDRETSKEIIYKVENLIKSHKFKVQTFDASQYPNPVPINPPKPIAPPAPKSKDKTEDSQNKTTIQPVEISIKKDNSLVLNGNPIKFEELTAAVDKLNSHLTIKEKRSYVTASIKLETNDSKYLAKKIGQELTKVDVFSNCIIFNNDDEQLKVTSNHISPNAGLTIEEAKAQQEKDLKAYEDSLESQNNKTKSPWSIDMGVTSVEAIDDSLHKQGPIEINGATYYFTQQNGKTTYYDSYGKVVDINNVPPPPPIPNKATPEQKAKMKKATEAYMKANPDKVGNVVGENGETIEVIEVPEDLQGTIDINGETFYYTTSNGKTTYYNGSGKEVKMDNLPPPPPSKNPSFLEFIIEMEQEGAIFYMDGKKITANEAKAIAKTNKGKKIEMITQKDENGTYIVKLSKQIKN